MRHTESGTVAESPVEMQFGKWTTEGEGKTGGFRQVSETQAGVNGRKCVGIFA